jgi:Fe-S cluster biogenesis protein NfuA
MRERALELQQRTAELVAERDMALLVVHDGLPSVRGVYGPRVTAEQTATACRGCMMMARGHGGGVSVMTTTEHFSCVG